MTYTQLAKQIRTQQSEYNQTVSALSAKLAVTKLQCKHNKVVIVCSEYGGSYSWDYDDGHDEYRQCLICGITECASKGQFKQLLNPIRRCELGMPFGQNSRYKQTPLANCLATPLKQLVEWVEKNGYQI